MTSNEEEQQPEPEPEHEEEEEVPKTRPDMLQAFCQVMVNDQEKISTFIHTVVEPLVKYVKSQKGVTDDMRWIEMFRQFQDMYTVHTDFVNSLQDNCTTENIQGPLGQWFTIIPKVIHEHLVFFHNYYLYSERFIGFNNNHTDFCQFYEKLEKNFNDTISEYLIKTTNYISTLTPPIERIRDLTNPGHKDDIKKCTTALDQISSAVQRSQASLQDGVPEFAKNYTFTPSNKQSTYGRIVDATVQDSTEKLRGKVISKISAHSQENIVQILSEIEANNRLHSTHILPVTEYFQDELFYYLIFPNCSGNELADVLTRNRSLLEESARPIFRELVQGVQHMHSNGVFHGQISPSRIVFYKNRVKIMDFSLCHLANKGEKKAVNVGPIMYSAPETMIESPYDGAPNDTWSCGVVLYEMVAGHAPFHARGKSTLQQAVKRGNVTYPNTFSPQLIFLLKGILNPIPGDRLTPEQILSHPWLLKTHEITIKNTLSMAPMRPKKTSPVKHSTPGKSGTASPAPAAAAVAPPNPDDAPKTPKKSDEK